MWYRDILLNIVTLSTMTESSIGDYFDSKAVSKDFQKLGNYGMPITMSQEYSPQAFSTKRISSDLDRLYRMGLLRRKRVKRWFRKDGRQFARGYRYLYSISEQGRSYIDYLIDNRGIPKKSKLWKKALSEDAPTVHALAVSNAPISAVAVIAKAQERKVPKDGVYKRFPKKFDGELYARLLEEQLGREKAEMRLRRSNSRVEHLEEMERIYKVMIEDQQKLSPLWLLELANQGFEKSSINPEIYPEGGALAEAFGAKIPSMPLLNLLQMIIRDLRRMGYT